MLQQIQTPEILHQCALMAERLTDMFRVFAEMVIDKEIDPSDRVEAGRFAAELAMFSIKSWTSPSTLLAVRDEELLPLINRITHYNKRDENYKFIEYVLRTNRVLEDLPRSMKEYEKAEKQNMMKAYNNNERTGVRKHIW
jgi:hypothetical protein